MRVKINNQIKKQANKRTKKHSIHQRNKRTATKTISVACYRLDNQRKTPKTRCNNLQKSRITHQRVGLSNLQEQFPLFIGGFVYADFGQLSLTDWYISFKNQLAVLDWQEHTHHHNLLIFISCGFRFYTNILYLTTRELAIRMFLLHHILVK